jgi:hypothetical protein
MTKASEQMIEFLSVAQDGPNYVSTGHIENCHELLAENERLREALRLIKNMHADNPSGAMCDVSREDYVEHILRCAKDVAREALECGE